MKLKSHNFISWIPHLFLFYKEKVFRKLLPIMGIIVLYALIIAYYFHNEISRSLGQFHLIFSFILTIIISFRVNTSYSRWWEARTLWGAIVNNCQNLGLKFEVFAGLKEYPDFYKLLSKLPAIIKANLRKDKNMLETELKSLGINEFSSMQPVLLVVQQMYFILNQLCNEQKLRLEQYLVLDKHLATLIDASGGCDRIANTRVPSAFAFFVKQGLLFYALMFPFGWVDTFGFFIVPMMVMIVYILLGLEILSEELEDPFGKGTNSLPLDIFTKNIACNIAQIAEIHP